MTLLKLNNFNIYKLSGFFIGALASPEEPFSGHFQMSGIYKMSQVLSNLSNTSSFYYFLLKVLGGVNLALKEKLTGSKISGRS